MTRAGLFKNTFGHKISGGAHSAKKIDSCKIILYIILYRSVLIRDIEVITFGDKRRILYNAD